MQILRRILWGTVCVFLAASSAYGQAVYPTSAALARMTMVESQYGRGSVFSIDVDGREYWITAKHILTGATHPPYGTVDANKTVSLKLLDPGSNTEHWITIPFKVIDPDKDSDIVVLAAPELVIPFPGSSKIIERGNITLGSECSFLGFPFGGGWRAPFTDGRSYWMPYVKRCTVSSIPGKGVLILDGINNHGFSGGPVLYGLGENQKIIGVISGYWEEPALVIPSAQKLKAPPKRTTTAGAGHVNVNSGFIVAYLIYPAIEAIRKTPIGPLRPTLPKE